MGISMIYFDDFPLIEAEKKKHDFPAMELISGSSRPGCSRPLWQLNLSRQR
jgi:hypothetical protein